MSRREDDLEELVTKMFGMRFSRPQEGGEEPIDVEATIEDVDVDADGAAGTSADAAAGDDSAADGAEYASEDEAPSHETVDGGASASERSAGESRGAKRRSAVKGAGEKRSSAQDGAGRKRKGSRKCSRKAAGWTVAFGGKGGKRKGARPSPNLPGRGAFIGMGVALIAVLAFCYWWFHPALNLQSDGIWGWVVLISVAVLAVLGLMSVNVPERARLLRRLMLAPAVFIAMPFVGSLLGAPFIPGNAERYANVLQTTDGTFAEDIEEVDYSEVPVIDRDSATLLGNRAMGSIPEYVSQFEISSTYSQINYQGRPVRVSPLVYADLFKWLSNREEGIPAYVLVDMVTQEAEVVRLEQPIKYSESEPLARNIDRYVQLKYPTYMFDQKSFELDEDGTPWWVFPVQKRTIGLFDGTTIQRVVLVNACTGETQDYAVEDCPVWVDRAYPSDLLIEQYNWSGAYQGGWLNSWLGQQGVVHATPGTDGQLGYNYLAQGDDVYLYTGVTSVTADNSNVGFILVNQRTGESHYYSVAGATEDSAMASAEGQVQNLKYHATYPLLLNVSGQPTYFMSLKDDAGLVKMYAMINVEQYQEVATGSTVEECQEDYLSLLAANGLLDGEGSADVADAAGLTASGTIATMAQAVVDGNSHFYVTLEGDGAIYDFALPSMLPIVRYKVGDALSFSYAEGDGVRTATKFADEQDAETAAAAEEAAEKEQEEGQAATDKDAAAAEEGAAAGA